MIRRLVITDNPDHAMLRYLERDTKIRQESARYTRSKSTIDLPDEKICFCTQTPSRYNGYRVDQIEFRDVSHISHEMFREIYTRLERY